jgi:hypothetical protein
MTQNVPFIIAQHLSSIKHNSAAIRGLAQLASSSSRVGRSFPNTDKRRYVKMAFIEFLNRFLRKRNRKKFIESDYFTIPLRLSGHPWNDTFYVDWSLDEMIDQFFVEYFTEYAREGFPQKKDFVVGYLQLVDILDGFYWVMERKKKVMEIVIPYRHMRTLMPKTLPTTQTGWYKLSKAVYTRSRTRGFVDPVAVNEVIDALINYYET